MLFQHTAIIGLGLLGGSLALDLREHYPEMKITGIARRSATLEEAGNLTSGKRAVFDHLGLEPSAAGEADLLMLCTPVQTIIDTFPRLVGLLKPGTVVSDVGSTKRVIMNAAAAALPHDIAFIGGHPMAGSEQTGLGSARSGLYRGATWALCVPPGFKAEGERLRTLVNALGARPLFIDPATHDEVVALTSHLPHVLAAALTNAVLGYLPEQEARPFIAGGFRDGTRVAAGSVAMWRDVLLTNRDQVLSALSSLSEEMSSWRDAIEAGDAAHLEALLTAAKSRRERI